jgi:hypothetical protein
MREKRTNIGKKEQRQIDARLTQVAKVGRVDENDVASRVVPKQRRMRGDKTK